MNCDRSQKRVIRALKLKWASCTIPAKAYQRTPLKQSVGIILPPKKVTLMPNANWAKNTIKTTMRYAGLRTSLEKMQTKDATGLRSVGTVSRLNKGIHWRSAYSTTCGHLFHAHVASHSMTCDHPREMICEAVSS